MSSCELRIKNSYLKKVNNNTEDNDTNPTFQEPTNTLSSSKHFISMSEENNKNKKRGMNKSRPKTNNIKDSFSLCNDIANCDRGENCKYSHDIELYLSEKEKDIGDLCYNFEISGFCKYGIQCRFASSHIDENHNNITNTEKFENYRKKPPVSNILDRSGQIEIRSKKLTFPRSKEVLKYIDSIKKNESSLKLVVIAGIQPEKNESFLQETDQIQPQSTNDIIPHDQIQPQATNDIVIEAIDKIGNQIKTIQNNLPNETLLSDSSDKQITEDVGKCETTFKLPVREKKRLDFKDKTYLAPLTTLGNLPFRRICKGFGVDITCGEMAVANNIMIGQPSEWALLRRHQSEDFFGVQLAGGYTDAMVKTAEMINDYCDVDFVDINCGCPIDTIFKTGAGSALMDRPNRIIEIVNGMNFVLDCSLTIKIRTGVIDSKPTAHKLISKLKDSGVGLITLHGRSRQQRYSRLADWDYIKTCSQETGAVPFFGNGDVMSPMEYYQQLEDGKLDGVMIGRGGLIKPWLFQEIKERKLWDISSSQRFDMLKDFSNFGLEYWGSDTMGVNKTRRFMCEWLGFLHRYVPVGLLETPPQKINERVPPFYGRDDLETLMGSPLSTDWIKISEMILGPSPKDFIFIPKHKSNAYESG